MQYVHDPDSRLAAVTGSGSVYHGNKKPGFLPRVREKRKLVNTAADFLYILYAVNIMKVLSLKCTDHVTFI